MAVAIPLAQLLSVMEASGKFTPEQLDEFGQNYEAANYEPKTRKNVRVDHFLDSDREITILKETHLLRIGNIDDWNRLLVKIPAWATHIFNEYGELKKKYKSIQAMMDKTSPLQFMEIIMSLLAVPQTDSYGGIAYTENYLSICEEIAQLVSDGTHQYTYETILSLPGSQLDVLIFTWWDVNKRDFLEKVWKRLPSTLTQFLSSLTGPLMSVLNGNALDTLSQWGTNLLQHLGTQENIGSATDTQELPKSMEISEDSLLLTTSPKKGRSTRKK